MSGHSKWAKIKRQKGANDAARGALFTKFSQAITLAAQEGGGDPNFNFTLRLAIDKAKAANMPSDNVERAVKKGTGELKSGRIEKVTYEAYGPGSIAVLIDTQTDNPNRTVNNVRTTVESMGGKMAGPGSVSWQFEEKGLISVMPAKLKKSEKFGKEDTYEKIDNQSAELEMFEIEGVEDIQEYSDQDDEGNNTDYFEIFTSKADLAKVREAVEKNGFKIETAEIIKIAKEKVVLAEDKKEKVENFMERLEELEDVQNVWTNVDLS
ncbi:YebC/PmpR family DNA-binding transcriptional regulator [Candidatus Dojkabacteria bacterium]|nr:YebC/PmpR family DNA-binding transcriptional regulator [Candidatus Dojkabacteria bacterium]